MKAWIGPSDKLLCLWNTNNIMQAYAWQLSIHVWLLGWSGSSSPSTKALQAESHILLSLSLSSSSSYLAQISFGGWRFLKQKQRAIYLDMPPATSLPFMSKTYSADWVLKQRFYVFQFGIITKFHDSIMFQKIAKWANFETFSILFK